MYTHQVYVSLLVASLGLFLFLEIAAELVEAVAEDPVPS